MSVLIKQATPRQIKALARRLQTVIPSVLQTGPLSLHQAQAIAAKGLGHADFHAAQVFEPPLPPFSSTSLSLRLRQIGHAMHGLLPGPPAAIVEVLMRCLGHAHGPLYPYWIERRLFITAVVENAWKDSSGASLTLHQIIAQLPLDCLMPHADAQFQKARSMDRHAFPCASLEYVEHLFRIEGVAGVLLNFSEKMDERAHEMYGVSWMDWSRVLRDLDVAPLKITTSEALYGIKSWVNRAYPYCENLLGSADQIIQQLSKERELELLTGGWSEKNVALWSGRALSLISALVHALVPMLNAGNALTRGHLLDGMHESRLAVLTHDQSPVLAPTKQALRAYMNLVPGSGPAFSDEAGCHVDSSIIWQEQHAFLVMQWVPLLRRFML